MAHLAQKQFFQSVKELYPNSFKDCKVLDCGSLDVNGSLKDLFEGGEYVGVDIHDGPNVDIVSPIVDLDFTDLDTIVSGEMLEHSETWRKDIQKMIDMLKVGGLLAISCAGKGRAEHGTARTGDYWGTSPDYYRNIEVADYDEFLPLFSVFNVTYNPLARDLYFYGIKK